MQVTEQKIDVVTLPCVTDRRAAALRTDWRRYSSRLAYQKHERRSVTSLGEAEGRIAPGDTIQGGGCDTRMKLFFVAEFRQKHWINDVVGRWEW